MSEIKIRLFGAFRNLQTEPELSVEVSGLPIKVSQLKEEIEKLWYKQNLSFDAVGLLKKSVLATEHQVLQDDEQVGGQERLALLPPFLCRSRFFLLAWSMVPRCILRGLCAMKTKVVKSKL
jgi:hypothetical protein